jgi:hypothetical protein
MATTSKQGPLRPDAPADAGASTDRPTGYRTRSAKVFAGLVAMVLAGTALLGFANPASAASAANAGRAVDTAALAAVPSCVWTYLDDSGSTDYLEVHNGCSSSVRVKVVLAFATDFACYTIAPGTYRWYTWGWPGRFDGLVDC